MKRGTHCTWDSVKGSPGQKVVGSVESAKETSRRHKGLAWFSRRIPRTHKPQNQKTRKDRNGKRQYITCRRHRHCFGPVFPVTQSFDRVIIQRPSRDGYVCTRFNASLIFVFHFFAKRSYTRAKQTLLRRNAAATGNKRVRAGGSTFEREKPSSFSSAGYGTVRSNR